MLRSEYMVLRFQRWHLPYVLDGGTLAVGGVGAGDPEVQRALERSPNCWTAIAEGLPIACGGTLMLWPGRHMAWAFLSQNARRWILSVTRTAREVVHRPKGRVECTVRADFPRGQGWAKVLGFEVENAPGILTAYGPEGEDHIAYVLLNR